MKYSKYYHSTINVYDIKYNKYYILDTNINILQLKETIVSFNQENNIINKYILYNKIVNIIGFDYYSNKCRYCNKSVITVKSKLVIKLSKQFKLYYIQSYVPQVQYRVLNYKYYKLSCCESCYKYQIIKYTNKIPQYKYWYMKNGISGMVMFGYSYNDYKKLASQTTGVTEQSMIRKWSETIGKQKWIEYKVKQAETNTYEYKKLKYNISKEEYNNYNKSRSVTLNNLIKKYGDEVGTKKYQEYINKQKLTKSWDYMVIKYGERKAQQINKSKIPQNLLSKSYSDISQELFKEIDSILFNKLNKQYTTYFAIKNNEYIIYNKEKHKHYCLDYYIKELNLCIEFNGDYWHCNPDIYNKDDIILINNNKYKAYDIWKKDKDRIDYLLKNYQIHTIVIWESDYLKNKQDCINNIINNLLYNYINK